MSENPKINLSENALKVLEKRYLQKDAEGNIVETPEQMFRRVAGSIASAESIYGKSEKEIKKVEEEFFRVMKSLNFLPNSPTLMNAGTNLGQLSACFVLSVDDSIESIYEAIKHAAIIHKSGGGTGFSFNRIRPKGSPVGTTSGVASGPVSFMKVFDASTEAIKQGGRRRGANMGILNVNHPDIMEFISCKEKEGELRNFNISVAVDDDFMEAAQRGDDYNLIDPRTGEIAGKLNASEVLDKIAEMAWKNGEPGIIFLDRMNQFNPTPRVGRIESTNPCGEQPLLPYESCLAPETRILTDKGWERIDEAYKRQQRGEKVSVYTDRVLENGVGLDLNSAIIVPVGKREVVKLELSNGQKLRLTPDHRVLTQRGWVPIEELEKSDYVYIMEGNLQSNPQVAEQDDEADFYQMSGWLVGDGWHTEKSRMRKHKIPRGMGVKNIVPDGVSFVYDVYEPKTHSLIAEGIIVHNCNLASINLAKMVEDGKINWDKLREVVHIATHFLDNVIDVNKYPLPQIEENTRANRKIGLGVMGFADMLIKLGISYNSKEALNLAQKVMSFIQDESKKASQKLAEERGVFPSFKKSLWEEKGIKLRNATTTTIAPTGSISMIADCSSGIEPLFSLVYYKEVLGGERLLYTNSEFEKIARERGFYSEKLIRQIAESNGSCQEIPEVPHEVKKLFITALDISYQDHIKMQAIFQRYTDNAVSKTINLPNQATKEEVRDAFILAYKLGCKGITVYRDKSREEQVIRAVEEEKKKLLTPRPRAKVTYGMTREIRTGCGDLYVTINEDERGEPFEIFAQLGKSGGCAASQTEAIGRLASLALRSGIPWFLIVKQLKGISCDRPWGLGKSRILSCADAVAKAIELYREEKIERGVFSEVKAEKPKERASGEILESESERGMGACPECGSSAIEYEGGCFVCRSCGYSECD